ncbi:MAG: hypothetical protein ACREFX_10105 [Opitutaceae bacterium]
MTGDSLFLAQQIAKGIAFTLGELEEQARNDPESARRYDEAFTAAAAKLLERFCTAAERRGFFHWDAAKTLHSATPLFARAELMAGLRQLAASRESTLLVTNLRPAFVPTGRRNTPRRQRDYAEALAFIRDLAASRTSRHANLQILFL